jgi:hypothetical protein
MKSYIERFGEFLSQYKKIRSYLELPSNLDGQFKVYNYDRYLGDNTNIEKDLVNILTSTNEKVLFVAPTGAGKTHTFMNVFNIVREKNSEQETIEGFEQVERQAINILFTPKKIQNIQNQNKYNNVKSITMSTNITKEDIEEYKNFSVVYDKANEVISTLEILMGNNDFLKMYYFNIVVDECHLLTSAINYRKDGLNRLQELINLVIENGGNVVYTTGTFDNCYILDFEKAIICNGENISNIKKVEEVICQPGMDSKSFVVNMVKKELSNNNKVLLRINDKIIIDNLKTQMEQQGYKVVILTREEKEESDLYKEIVENGSLNCKYDLYILTCIIDEGVTIDIMSDNTQPTNIVPMFFFDRQNTNLLDYKQFAARIRWSIEKSVLLVDKHESNIEDIVITLDEIVKKESINYVRYYNSFVSILNGFNGLYQDETKVKESIEKILNEKDFFGRVNHMHLYSYKNGRIDFDYFDCFNRMFNKYMAQFLNFDIERKYFLQDLFGVEVISTLMSMEDMKETYTDFTSLKFENFLDELAKDEDLQVRFEVGNYQGLREVKRDKRFEQLVELTKYTTIEDSIATIKSNPTKEVTHIIRDFEKEVVLTLTSDEVKKMDIYIAKDNLDLLTSKMEKVAQSSYIELIKEAANLGINVSKFKDICKDRTYTQMVEYLKEEQVIQNNKNIRSRQIAGRSCMEQNMFVTIVNNFKDGKQQVTLRENDLIEIKDLMCKTTKSNWTKQGIKKFLLLVFNVSMEDKKYLVKDLKYKHTL